VSRQEHEGARRLLRITCKQPVSFVISSVLRHMTLPFHAHENWTAIAPSNFPLSLPYPYLPLHRRLPLILHPTDVCSALTKTANMQSSKKKPSIGSSPPSTRLPNLLSRISALETAMQRQRRVHQNRGNLLRQPQALTALQGVGVAQGRKGDGNRRPLLCPTSQPLWLKVEKGVRCRYRHRRHSGGHLYLGRHPTATETATVTAAVATRSLSRAGEMQQL
jgi:hypothetical protein